MVNEKSNIEKDKTSSTTENITDGNQPKELSKIERAELAVQRMEEAEKRLDEKIAKLTELEANRLLGSSAGGRVEPQPVKEETAQEYADRIMKNQIKAQ
jgi:cobalamin biosynthesis Mg chelatase CobN